jgi:hypothetical protein
MHNPAGAGLRRGVQEVFGVSGDRDVRGVFQSQEPTLSELMVVRDYD